MPERTAEPELTDNADMPVSNDTGATGLQPLTTLITPETLPAPGGGSPVVLFDANGQPMAPISAADLPATGPKKPQPPGLIALAGVDEGPKPSSLELIPGRYPDAVSLTTVLAQLASSPEAQGFINNFITDLEQKTGLIIPPALKSAAQANPVRLIDALKATPEDIAAGLSALNTAYQAGQLKPPAPKKRQLVGQRFDLSQLETAQIERPKYQLKTLAPGLLQGDLASNLPDDQARRNIVVAEIFDRLAANAQRPKAEQFGVYYGAPSLTGHQKRVPIRRLDQLLSVLAADDHRIEARVQHRIANFADLKTQAPDGSYLDVPAALMVRVQLPDGKEALVPTLHSELVFSIRSGPDTKGPPINADFKWYQGVPDTGFFPADLSQIPSWCGMKVVDQFKGKDAIDAVILSGLMGDLINTTAEEQKLYLHGYGATGVCNDSVSIIQHALTGDFTAYPLMMRDATVLGALDARLTDLSKLHDPYYTRLKNSVVAVPSDFELNASSFLRAHGSLPWVDGMEPFYSSVEAKQLILPFTHPAAP